MTSSYIKKASARSHSSAFRFALLSGALLCAASIGLASRASAQELGVDCAKFLPAKRTVNGKTVGPSSCRVLENKITYNGNQYLRLDVGLNGTVDGYVSDSGTYHEYLTNSPDLVFAQAGNSSPRHFGIATYERAMGAAMTVVLPSSPGQWNGKMWVLVHGRGVSVKEGNLKPWDKLYDQAAPTEDLNRYVRLLMDKGYAVVISYRTSTEGLGEIKTVLDDGRTVDWAAFNDTVHYIMDFTRVAQNLTKARLGKAPRLTYQWGHSAGARVGHDINYTPGLNVGADGKPFFAGVLADDAAAGTWLPFVIKDGKDVLYTTPESQAGFVPQLDVVHEGYNAIADRMDHSQGSLMSWSYLANKRHNAKMLLDKGLGSKERTYEVRGITHQGGENIKPSRFQNLPLSNMMDKFFDILDAWVDKGVEPPPSHSDWAPVGRVTTTGEIEHPALVFPEISCPLGVYHAAPDSTSGNTAFYAFTGKGIEPLDKNKQFIDMNRNGTWDFVETPTEAWRRLGLIGKTDTLTRDRYVECVRSAADRLQKDGFFSAKTVAGYIERAGTDDLQPKAIQKIAFGSDPITP